METAFRTILCPIDFDRAFSAPAIEMARKLASQGESKTILLHVLPANGQKPTEEVFEAAQDSMRAISRRWFKTPLLHEIVIRAGSPAAEIIRAADELGADLIVMATHGRTGIGHLLVGSVAERVVRESELPVLTVRPH
jgi:nucleotide-binding universal stress UspA family protein